MGLLPLGYVRSQPHARMVSARAQVRASAGIGRDRCAAVLRKFAYALDPVCLSSWALYAVNRFAHPTSPFFRNHFNDVLFIPAVLPLMLWVHRRLGLRRTDGPPTASEVVLHFAGWSIAAEVIAPLISTHSTGDVLDVVAYAAGSLVAWLVWNRP